MRGGQSDHHGLHHPEVEDPLRVRARGGGGRLQRVQLHHLRHLGQVQGDPGGDGGLRGDCGDGAVTPGRLLSLCEVQEEDQEKEATQERSHLARTCAPARRVTA